MVRLIADIGGTNARFALADADGVVQAEQRLPVRDHAGPVEAARAYLGTREVDDAVFAVATPVEQDLIQFTNSPWRFSIEATREALGLRRLAVINDFVAQALAVARIGEGDRFEVGGAAPVPGRAIAVIGPGTGLGVAGLVPHRGRLLAVPSEGGHVSLAPADARERRILAHLQARFGHVSNERVVSGPGLLNLCRAIAEIDSASFDAVRPEDVTTRAAAGQCAVSAEAVARFCAWLGAAAGDLALTFGARGGVYVTGGICKRLGPLFDAGAFRSRFEAKGRLASFLAPIPVWVVTRSGMGLIGAAAYDADLGGV